MGDWPLCEPSGFVHQLCARAKFGGRSDFVMNSTVGLKISALGMKKVGSPFGADSH